MLRDGCVTSGSEGGGQALCDVTQKAAFECWKLSENLANLIVHKLAKNADLLRLRGRVYEAA